MSRDYANQDNGPLFDICEARHKGSPESKSANKRISACKSDQREKVYHAIARTGNDGLTVKELGLYWGVGINTISGRFSELKAEDRIVVKVVAGERVRRDGCAVHVKR